MTASVMNWKKIGQADSHLMLLQRNFAHRSLNACDDLSLKKPSHIRSHVLRTHLDLGGQKQQFRQHTNSSANAAQADLLCCSALHSRSFSTESCTALAGVRRRKAEALVLQHESKRNTDEFTVVRKTASSRHRLATFAMLLLDNAHPRHNRPLTSILPTVVATWSACVK